MNCNAERTNECLMNALIRHTYLYLIRDDLNIKFAAEVRHFSENWGGGVWNHEKS